MIRSEVANYKSRLTPVSGKFPRTADRCITYAAAITCHNSIQFSRIFQLTQSRMASVFDITVFL